MTAVHVFDPASPGWTDALSRAQHDVYHLPAYLSFAARRHDVGDPRLFVIEGSDGSLLLLPVIVRPIPSNLAGDSALFDAVSPRGYPGPITSGLDEVPRTESANEAAGALVAALRERGIVSAYVRLHPLLSPDDGMLQAHGVIVDHGDSVYIDLTVPDSELVGQMRHGHRQDIRRAKRNGYRARIDEGWERFDDFVTLFQRSMERVGALPFWRLTGDYFVDLRDSLVGRIHLCVVEKDGSVASAALLTEVDGIVEYHLAGTAEAHLRASPSKVLVDFARGWSTDRGNRVLHLTGSLRRGDSLSSFKQGFSPLHRPVRSWRIVADAKEYERLASRWSRLHGTAPDSAEGFFPAYRKPGPRAE